MHSLIFSSVSLLFSRETFFAGFMWAAGCLAVVSAMAQGNIARWVHGSMRAFRRQGKSRIHSSLGIDSRGWALPEESPLPARSAPTPARMALTSFRQAALPAAPAPPGRPLPARAVLPRLHRSPAFVTCRTLYQNGQTKLIPGTPPASSGTGTRMLRFSREVHGNAWARQDIVYTPTALTRFVTNPYRELMRTYWFDQTGILWESQLVRSGFSSPAARGWWLGTEVLHVAYYILEGMGQSEPTLYDVTSTQLWVRTLHGTPRQFPPPGPMSDDIDFTISRTGRHSWARDTDRDRGLRLWNGYFDTAFAGLISSRAAEVSAMRVFGACNPPRPRFPQPLFVASNGPVYRRNSRHGSIPRTVAGQKAALAPPGARLSDDCLAYIAHRNEHIVVIRQMCNGTQWGGFRVTSRALQSHTDNIVPGLQTVSLPALSTTSDTDLMLLSSSSDAAATAAGRSAAWVS